MACSSQNLAVFHEQQCLQPYKKDKRELHLVPIEKETGAIAMDLKFFSSIVAVLLPPSPVFFAFISQYVITSTSPSSKVMPVVIGMRGANTLSIGLI